MKTKNNLIKRLLYIIFLDQIAITLTFPLITLIFFDETSRLFPENTSFATRSLWYGLINALPNLLNLFFAPILSSLSDVYGRKKILVLEIISGSLFGLLLAFGVYFGNLLFIFFAFIIRGTTARTNPTALAIVGDSAEPHQKLLQMGYLQFAISAGACLGPMLGGVIASRFFFTTLNYSFAFFVVASLAFFNTFIAMNTIHETLHDKTPLSTIHKHAVKQTFMHHDVLRISLLLFFIQFAWGTFYQFMPPFLKSYLHFNDDKLSLYIGIISLWLLIASSIGLKCLRRFFDTPTILITSLYTLFFGFLIILFALFWGNPYIETLFWLSAIPIAMGDVISFVCISTYYSNVVPKNAQGSVMGVCLIIRSLAWGLSSFLGGFLLSLSPILLFFIAFFCLTLALVMIYQPLGQTIQTKMSSG